MSTEIEEWHRWVDLCFFLALKPIPGWRVLSRRELYARLGLKEPA